MNIHYHLTEEEAREGLNGLYPQFEKGSLLIGLVFLILTINQVIMIRGGDGGTVRWFVAVGCFVISVWFLANRWFKIYFVARRSAPKDNRYMIVLSPEGWVRPGKGEKILFAKDKTSFAVETAKTISFYPCKDHLFVIPKSCLSKQRLQELRDMLEELKCPLKNKEK